MKKKNYVLRVLWFQGLGFLLIIALMCVSDTFRLASETTNFVVWRNCLLKIGFVLMVAVAVMIPTGKLISRLYRLEGFLSLCAWCKKMRNDQEWIPLEEYLKKQFEIESSHDICPACYAEARQELKNFKPI